MRPAQLCSYLHPRNPKEQLLFLGSLKCKHYNGSQGGLTVGNLLSKLYEKTLLEKFISLAMFIMNGITYGKIDYRTFSISFMPAISLFFIFLKNLTHPLHSK